MIEFNIYKLLLYLAGIMLLLWFLRYKVKHNKLLFYIAGVGFILNLIWEMVQMPLYAGYKTFADHLVCLPASIGDVFAVLAIYTVISFVREDWYWVKNIEKRTITLSIIIGGLLAIVMEQIALLKGLWAYTDQMPLLPLVEVGLSPFLQMILLPLLTYGISYKMYKKYNSQEGNN